MAHRVLNYFPRGASAHYWVQRKVTRTLPESSSKYRERIEVMRVHLNNLAALASFSPNDAVALEIGAGWDLLSQFLLYAVGFQRQIVLDVKPLIRIELLNRAIEEVRAFAAEVGQFPHREWRRISQDPVGELRNSYGIEYRAPADARATGLPDGSVDFIVSTNTFEHIPRSSLVEILKEFRRLLSRRGLMSLRIDYQDHYSFSDRRISAFNFLRFAESDWRKFNPDSHFQNRMRHGDYLELIRTAGFDVSKEEPRRPSKVDMDLIATLPLSAEFQGRELADLGTRTAVFAVR